MEENKILASVALFSELYDNKKDIYDVIAQFIKTAIITEAKWILTPVEAVALLKQMFDFEIPLAVVKVVLKKRLLRDGVLSFENGSYNITSEEIKRDDRFLSEFDTAQNNYARISESLVSYVESKMSRKFEEKEISDLYLNFKSYLLENFVSEKYLQYISSFIIENQNEQSFTESLTAIKEGLVLYTGIKYTTPGELNELGSWNSEMTIFLDTEHLFNIVGYNGILFADIFKDFYKLVQEINQSSKVKTGRKIIELKYFEETKNEVDNFFYVAEKIIDGHSNIDPSKTAMQTIINGCKTASDVIVKKSKFFEDIKRQGISIEEKRDYYKNHDYIIESKKILEIIEKQSTEMKKYFNEEDCLLYLRLFTKINTLRQGASDRNFEKIGCILLTGNGTALFLAHNNIVKLNDRDIPFATDIDFLTDKFWFKLKKGFNDKNSLPKSFDIITRARIVLSSQMRNSISKEYSKLIKSYKMGEITKEQATSINNDLKGRSNKPEDITPIIADESLAFLNDDSYVENHLMQQSMIQMKVDEGEKAIKELSKRKIQDWLKAKQPVKFRVQVEYWLTLILFNFIVAGFILGLASLIYKLSAKVSNLWDSVFDILGVICLFVIEIIPLLKYKKINSWLKLRIKKKYKKRVLNLLEK